MPRGRHASAQPAKFEDVVRNLRNPDAKIRLSAVRLLREARYTEAIVPMAPLVTDPIDDIQLEAIAPELSFFLVETVPRASGWWRSCSRCDAEGRAPAAFDAGPLAVWPKAAPAELIDALLTAVDDEHKKVRLEAIYTLGVVAGASGAPLPDARPRGWSRRSITTTRRSAPAPRASSAG